MSADEPVIGKHGRPLGPIETEHPRETVAHAPCADPSRYRYQRGCRCSGCVAAQAEYKRKWHEKRAAAEGREHGAKKCELCGVSVSVIGSSNAKRYCDECASLSKKEQDRRYRERVKESGPKPGSSRTSGIYELRDLPVDRLTVGDDVRLDEDPEALADLAESIAEIGVLQPLVVRVVGEDWEVIAGRRRLAAARMAEQETVPCVIRDLDDERAFDVTLAENLHRRELSWIEVALSYDRLRARGLQQREIAALVSKSESQVSQVLRLLTLPEEAQRLLHTRQITLKAALRKARNRGQDDSHFSGAFGSTDADRAMATHWSRRHGRLLAGIVAVIKATDDPRDLLQRLIREDRKPLDERGFAQAIVLGTADELTLDSDEVPGGSPVFAWVDEEATSLTDREAPSEPTPHSGSNQDGAA